MRSILASLAALSVLYFLNKDYNNGRMLDGLTRCDGPSFTVSSVKIPELSPPIIGLDAMQREPKVTLPSPHGPLSRAAGLL
jgi:hypothetical protein